MSYAASSPAVNAYLDIETTGLSFASDQITVVGIFVDGENGGKMTQLVGKDISRENLMQALDSVSTINTYNGSRFDLPFIDCRCKLDLSKFFDHCDLMYNCWQNGLYGGLKRVEQQLCIPRKLTGINGWEAIKLWWRYIESFDLDALNTLLEYNKEDVINLKALKEKLRIRPSV